jgi:nitrite reductase/ring-hydroxylating ferredoxin subunit
MTTHIFAAKLSGLKTSGCLTAQVDGHTLALFLYGDAVYAVDNRCPHMGFPLDRGTVKDGLLTCHWHHARFDLASGGAFDLFADDVRAFPTEIRNDEVWVDLAPQTDLHQRQRRRLRDGLERDLPLVIAKSAINLLDSGVVPTGVVPTGVVPTGGDPVEPFRIGLEFGTRYRQEGWGQGLTILTCMMNLMPYLVPEDRSRAMYHGLSAVAANTFGMPPRFTVQPLPTTTTDIPTLKRWFRGFVEVRDAEGAERCIVSAVRAGADDKQLADLLFAAATDHRYLQIGHVLDFTNKALEALDHIGWANRDLVELVLSSLANGYANADRMEESNAWRNPIDLIEILENTFSDLTGLARSTAPKNISPDLSGLAPTLLGDDPQQITYSLMTALREGCSPVELAGAVAYAAALRIACFHTSNEFGDWDTALHTFTFANAVHQGLRRLSSSPAGAIHEPPLQRGIFDAAMSIYLDRFLNVPPARLPEPNGKREAPETILKELPSLLDRQQQVDTAGEQVAAYFFSDGNPAQLLALLGKLLLREDRDFHTIQTVEAAFRQYDLLRGGPEGVHVLVAAARYLAAHSPTMRAQGQTYQIASRLSRGERVFE